LSAFYRGVDQVHTKLITVIFSPKIDFAKKNKTGTETKQLYYGSDLEQFVESLPM
jgi:hypothetical protein